MEKQNRFQIISHWICVIGLSGAFTYWGAIKLSDLPAFYQDVLSFQLVSGELALFPVYIVPSLELVCGIALLVPMLKRGSSLCIAVLMILFALMFADAWIRGIDVSCGCFGKTDATSSSAAKGIAIDLALFAVAAWVFVTTKRPRR